MQVSLISYLKFHMIFESILMKRTFMIFVSVLLSPIALAAPDYWSFDYNGGYAEYMLENDSGYTVNIRCNDADKDDGDHSLYVGFRGESGALVDDSSGFDQTDVPVELIIDGMTYKIPDETFTNNGSNKWGSMISALSSANEFKLFWNGEFIGNFSPKNTQKMLSGMKKTCLSMIDWRTKHSYNNEFTEEPLLLPKEAEPKHTRRSNKKIDHDSLRVSYNIVDQGYGTSSTYIYIVSLENFVSIEGIAVNRGNCELFRGEKGGIVSTSPYLPKHLREGGDSFPVHLKYGQQTYFVFNNCPNVLELTVKTNIGAASYDF